MSKPFGGGQNDTHHLKEQVDQVTQCRCKARLLGCEQWERTQSYPPPLPGQFREETDPPEVGASALGASAGW